MKVTRKPSWLKVSAFSGERFQEVNRLLKQQDLHTVCQAANCPNRGECFNRGTATFLIMGNVCTRNCRFCDVPPGLPQLLDSDEPSRVASVAAELQLKHVVVTSVTRDDLPDGGARHFMRTVKALREQVPNAIVEILTPDFKLKPNALDILFSEPPDIFNHNMETVFRLYPTVRPQADYNGSLLLLKSVALQSEIKTKSGFMVGLGETVEELKQLCEDLADSHVSMLTIGQYLAPSPAHVPVEKYYHPDEFVLLKEIALSAGIPRVFSAPLVRSSYMADQQ